MLLFIHHIKGRYKTLKPNKKSTIVEFCQAMDHFQRNFAWYTLYFNWQLFLRFATFQV